MSPSVREVHFVHPYSAVDVAIVLIEILGSGPGIYEKELEAVQFEEVPK